MRRLKSAGFSTLELILVVVIVGLIGAVGYMVYSNKQDDKPVSVAKKTSNSQTTKPKAVASTPFVNVIQQDETVTQSTPEKVGKTADQVAILTTLHDSCTGNDTYVTVNTVTFEDGSNYIQDGKYASINATACSKIAKSLNDLEGSGARYYLHKNNSGKWLIDSAGQMGPLCSKVDGLGYPTSLISTCNDDTNDSTRPPKS